MESKQQNNQLNKAKRGKERAVLLAEDMWKNVGSWWGGDAKGEEGTLIKSQIIENMWNINNKTYDEQRDCLV